MEVAEREAVARGAAARVRAPSERRVRTTFSIWWSWGVTRCAGSRSIPMTCC